jgi:hypothetical protein
MLGFLAAFLAIAVAISQSGPFNSYRQGGHLTVQLWLVTLAMGVLVVGFIFSLSLMTALVNSLLVILNIYFVCASLLLIVIALSPIIFMLLQVSKPD